MTPRPVTDTPIPTPLEPKARLVWIEPEIEALSLEQTETLDGRGHDGSFGQAPDCTRS
jgi:hypothetical protein